MNCFCCCWEILIDQNSFPDPIDTPIHNFDLGNNGCMNLVDEYPMSLQKNKSAYLKTKTMEIIDSRRMHAKEHLVGGRILLGKSDVRYAIFLPQ